MKTRVELACREVYLDNLYDRVLRLKKAAEDAMYAYDKAVDEYNDLAYKAHKDRAKWEAHNHITF